MAPPLEEITPVTDNVHAVMENFVPARDSRNWIDVRLASLPVRFVINGGNMIDSNSDVYQRIRRSIYVGDEMTVWAIP